jgi:hypothetical protein
VIMIILFMTIDFRFEKFTLPQYPRLMWALV